MPAHYSLGQHAALEDVAAEFLPTEKVCAFLDDWYVLCKPDRVRHLYSRVEHHLYKRIEVRLNMGKTKVFNHAGVKPPRVDELGRCSR